MSENICTVCNKLGVRKCYTCGSAYYCSQDYRLDDEPTHKVLCQPRVDFLGSNPRPIPQAKLEIAFPIFEMGVVGKHPHFIWLHNREMVELDAAGKPKYTNVFIDEAIHKHMEPNC
ncbi:hypothetical protein B0J14DRAFT_655662 [Halenospora varia]|nr:hypothetical protein B0J14DRAFT_655662 [Halenospora varia]